MFCLGKRGFRWNDLNQISGSSYTRYYCKLCPYSTILKYDFVKHNVVHTGERPFECDVCKRRFSRKDSMKRHIDRHHGRKMASQ